MKTEIKITYTQVGDYLLPNIILNEPPEEITPPLGRYAHLHKEFLQEHRPILYNQLLLTEKLYPLLREVDESARRRLRKVNEADRPIIEEGILAELVYV